MPISCYRRRSVICEHFCIPNTSLIVTFVYVLRVIFIWSRRKKEFAMEVGPNDNTNIECDEELGWALRVGNLYKIKESIRRLKIDINRVICFLFIFEGTFLQKPINVIKFLKAFLLVNVKDIFLVFYSYKLTFFSI